MGALVSIIIILGALATVVGVMWAVLKEKHEPEPYFIPPEEEVPAEKAVTAVLTDPTEAEPEAQ
jgi:hypothetical protein